MTAGSDLDDLAGEVLVDEVLRALADDGPLAHADPSHRVRPSQNAMAAAVAQAVQERGSLVVEAGTGVGKTFAYLIPLLLSGRRALISTATKSLQDQLFLRDLPRLKALLGVNVRTALLKGRASYLCLHRLGRARQQAELPDRWAVRTLARIEQWSAATRTGDLAEIDGLDDRSPVIPLVTSTRDNCLGSECPQFGSCHVVQARREAMAADLVVVNHHLFFADLSLRDSGVAELLPTVDAAVFDEAHQLVDAALPFLGATLSTHALQDLARDLLATGLGQARGLQAWPELAAALDRSARDLRLACAGSSQPRHSALRLRWRERARDPQLAVALESAQQALGAAQVALEAMEGHSPDFERMAQRCAESAAVVAGFQREATSGRVRWIDVSASSARLVESPLDIRDPLTEQRRRAPKAWVFTSATLGDDDSLSWFVSGTGLEDARALRVGSPFDYPALARLWIPQDMPLPNAADHPRAVAQTAARCAARLGGRTFVLTTTLKVLPMIAQALRECLADLGVQADVLVQGDHPKRVLMRDFGDGRHKVLVGSHSFWEGIDVPGDALQCVVIDKLPFPPPNDPLVEARVAQYRAQGQDAFNLFFVAETAIALKQGAGRLIRSETDRGLLVVCDPRLAKMGYGKRLVAALPAMARLDDEAAAMQWLSGLRDYQNFHHERPTGTGDSPT